MEKKYIFYLVTMLTLANSVLSVSVDYNTCISGCRRVFKHNTRLLNQRNATVQQHQSIAQALRECEGQCDRLRNPVQKGEYVGMGRRY